MQISRFQDSLKQWWLAVDSKHTVTGGRLISPASSEQALQGTQNQVVGSPLRCPPSQAHGRREPPPPPAER
uniref:Uncharacterized protein n=1 Tax=Oryza sativa subsp. japonica TaxID=39947 RepID=Q69KZ6_ORYSJ|nr:hypothetical protein [Oryza sativa Japonica Group]BAD34121.1 hypothetical protein [Oryza sativa Japonica Group]